VNNASGQGPSGLAIDGRGVLYGTTLAGGANDQEACGGFGCGTVFSLAPPSVPGGAWAEKVLWNFGGVAGDGVNPLGAVVVGSGGVLYGVAFGAGGACSCGVVFSLSLPGTPGDAWTETILWAFGSVTGDGKVPQAGLAIANGVLYGTTSKGGRHGAGTVFSLAPPTTQGNPWTMTQLWSFGSSATDGSVPNAAVSISSGGVLFGTTSSGGAYGFGTVYSLSPPDSAGKPWTEDVLQSFDSTSGQPNAVVIGEAGKLLGVTSGSNPGQGGEASSLSPPASPGGTWSETVLATFPHRRDAVATVNGPLCVRPSGLYGTTGSDGPNAGGALFRLRPPTAPGVAGRSQSYTTSQPASSPRRV
jgi:uncharacterized repeat protein (TIGR03803 family)